MSLYEYNTCILIDIYNGADQPTHLYRKNHLRTLENRLVVVNSPFRDFGQSGLTDKKKGFKKLKGHEYNIFLEMIITFSCYLIKMINDGDTFLRISNRHASFSRNFFVLHSPITYSYINQNV